MTTDDHTGFTRTETSFMSDGVRCAATVFRPAMSAAKALPAIVMAHGFGSPRALRLYAYAERFVEAGYVVCVFDYRFFGDSDGEPRQLLDVVLQLADWRNAVDFARSLDGVDENRIVGWGTSFAGGHVLTLAGNGVRFAAVIAQVPHIDGIAAVRATGFRQGLRLAPAAITDIVRAALGRSPHYVDSVGLPGARAVMVSPDAMKGRDRLLHESGLSDGDYPETVAARILLKIWRYSPGRTMSAIECPTLVQIASDDSVTPASVAQRAAAQVRKATVRTYSGGHFDPYVEPLFSSVIRDQLTFLADNVPLQLRAVPSA
ncbi:alpha/beta hydrolase [Rhodococcoides yunnanense]|uniref:Alpha/beta fold hydrolase n=1 Tax=Rhodococcoides yunnanense TaxID=278209 RepID=A0ABU4BJG4_9NOCA|nr:alpha/beta fold hydrolase [Rhodococcus yunnanensis]MDV6264357.1 alpha/beta fold hydrolase [Rhodococcus yunnanensis]